MLLTVKQAESAVNELKFERGPIYIGRQIGSQVFLPDVKVSRQHAVIYNVDQDWVVEDLDTPNKTYLNGKAIHKSHVSHGDTIAISDYSIRIDFEREESKLLSELQMEDTLHSGSYESQLVVRNVSSIDAPVVRFPVRRLKDFSEACCALSQPVRLEQFLDALLDILLKQFQALHAWVGVCNKDGNLVDERGRKIGLIKIGMNDLALAEIIGRCISHCDHILVPRIANQRFDDKVRSVMAVPIGRKSVVAGVMYVDNSMIHEHYGMVDLDYMILLAEMCEPLLRKLM